jgi:hypothetical protein
LRAFTYFKTLTRAIFSKKNFHDTCLGEYPWILAKYHGSKVFKKFLVVFTPGKKAYGLGLYQKIGTCPCLAPGVGGSLIGLALLGKGCCV